MNGYKFDVHVLVKLKLIKKDIFWYMIYIEYNTLRKMVHKLSLGQYPFRSTFLYLIYP